MNNLPFIFAVNPLKSILKLGGKFPAGLIAVLVLAPILRLPAEESSILPEVLQRCRAALDRLKYVEYTVKGTPIDEINHPRIQMTWREEGNKIAYSYIQWKDNGAENFRADYSYDGERSFNTWYGKGLYYTKRSPRPFDDWIKNLVFVTAPFDFLVLSPGVPAWTEPNISVLQNTRTWLRLAKDMTVIGTQPYKDRQCMVLQINNAMSVWYPKTVVHYMVYFDLKSAMPIAWKLYNEQNHLMEEDNVTAEQPVTADQETYLAPRQIRRDYYAFNDVKKADERTHSWVYDFSNIVTSNSADEDFTLDPANARQIYDEDNKVWIHVPK